MHLALSPHELKPQASELKPLVMSELKPVELVLVAVLDLDAQLDVRRKHEVDGLRQERKQLTTFELHPEKEPVTSEFHFKGIGKLSR